MFLALKWEGGGWFIGSVEVAWKVCTAVVNFRLKRGVVLHEALKRFIEGWEKGTATLEANMAQHLSGFAQEPLYQFS